MNRSTTNPYVVGVVMGLLFAFGIIIGPVWFPVLESEDSKRWIDFSYFTAFLFFVLISTNWRFHRKRQLWVALGIFFLAHTAGIFMYMKYVKDLLPRNYVVLLFFETIVGELILQQTAKKSKKEASA